MIPYVRAYESETQAHEAARKLAEAGFGDDAILLVTAADTQGAQEAALGGAVRAEILSDDSVRHCSNQLKKGRSIVAVRAIFGQGATAERILDSCGPVTAGALPGYDRPSDAAPLSDALGIPTVVSYSPMSDVIRPDYSRGGILGLPLLTDGGTPFAPGPPDLYKGEKTSTFGLPLLASSGPATPVTLSSPKRPWTSSFGFPLLSNSPAPLSSLFGIPTLSRDD